MRTIPLHEPCLGTAEQERLEQCIASGFVSTSGRTVSEFESAFARYVGSSYAVATSSGTAALHVALVAAGVQPGDTVLIPDLTFVATANSILYCGARPALVDVSAETWCMDPDVLRDACHQLIRDQHQLKAIVPVHLYGCAGPMDEILDIAKSFGLMVIEDAAEALGTTYRGAQAGTLGTAGCFSFNGNKIITTGSGGMICTNSKDLSERIRHLINQAKDKNAGYFHTEMGFNYGMNNLAGAMGMAQLDRLPDLLKKKHEIASRYQEAFCDIPSVRCHDDTYRPDQNHWLFSVQLQEIEQREVWMQAGNEHGIELRPFFTPLHQQPFLKQAPRFLRSSNRQGMWASVSSKLAAHGLNLPSSATLTPQDQNFVIQVLLRSVTQRSPRASLQYPYHPV